MDVTSRRAEPNVAAARLLKTLREKAYLERSRLPHAMATKGIPLTSIPSERTIYRIEEMGQEPTLAVKGAFAEFYGFDLHSVWPAREPRCARLAVAA